MRRLYPVNADFTTLLRKIISEKNDPHRSRLSSLESAITYRVEEYNSNLSDLSEIKVRSYSPKQKDSLLSFYNSKTRTVKDLIGKIYKINGGRQNWCCYCGMHRGTTLDHYLPKESYPEFSIYPLNLIPCCGNCNSKKGEVTKSNSSRAFLNFYLDELTDIELLKVDIFLENGTLNYRFYILHPPHMPDTLIQLYLNHHEELDLLEEYPEAAAVEYRNARNIASRISSDLTHEQKQQELALRLRDMHENSLKMFGQNNWQSALYSQASTSDVFINFCLYDSGHI